MNTATPVSSKFETLRALILIPVQDEADYIEACLQSIMKPPASVSLEVIVIDDHSSDDTVRKVKKVAGLASEESAGMVSIRLLRNPGRGKAAALNHGFSQAEGSDVVILLGGDDVLLPDALPDRIRAVAGTSDAALATCRYRTISTDPRLSGAVLPRREKTVQIAGGAASFNRRFAELYFPIPAALPSEDCWLQAVAVREGVTCSRLQKIGLLYRLHARNTTGPVNDFKRASQQISDRAAAYRLALDTTHRPTNAKALKDLQALILLEKLRHAGKWWAIPLVCRVPLADRAAAFFNSRETLYKAKQQLFWLRRR